MRLIEFLQKGGRKYTDKYYDDTEVIAAQRVGIPIEMLRSIRLKGERSNENQVSEAQARGVYQFIPSTRASIKRIYGYDAWDPSQASLAAASLLKESLIRHKGDHAKVYREYHGGTDPDNWGPRTKAYVNRTVGYNTNTTVNHNDNTSANYQQDVYTQTIPDEMKSNLNDWSNFNKSVKQNSKYLNIVDPTIKDQIEQSVKLDLERQQQEIKKNQLEQENLMIQAKLAEKQAERQRILSMVPQAQAVGS